MTKITEFTGKSIAIRGNDIDTDRIIPARFMKCITFEGLGRYAFNDERVDGKGDSKNHPFDNDKYRGNPILIVNSNFGCGSSREHAPQALKDYGNRAFIGESFGEIFAGNCLSLGMPAVTMDHKDISELQAHVESHPDTEISINLETMTLSIKGWDEKPIHMPEEHRLALISGNWDSTSVLAANGPAIDQVATRLPYVQAV